MSDIHLQVQTLAAPVRPGNSTPANASTSPTAGEAARFAREDHAHLAPTIDLFCNENISDLTDPPSTIDGWDVEDGLVVGLAGQSDPTENGIYVVTGGVLSRHDAYSTGGGLNGSVTTVRFGAAYQGAVFGWNANGTLGSVAVTASSAAVSATRPAMVCAFGVGDIETTAMCGEVMIPIGETTVTVTNPYVNELTKFFLQVQDGDASEAVRVSRSGGQFFIVIGAPKEAPVTVAYLCINPFTPPSP